jgi:DNA-binding transcriptional MocR family regulator
MGFWHTFTIDGRSGPKYLAIRDALAESIRSGRLGAGRRLPSHRFLATRLGVSVGTVTRAYELALEDGLIASEVGRGTFVSHYQPTPLSVVDSSRIPPGCADLYQNIPVLIREVEQEAWQETLEEIAREVDLPRLARATWSEVSQRNRRAGATWIGRVGLAAPEANIFDCPGVMSTLCAIVGAVTSPHDLVVAPALSHPLIRLLADQYGLRIQGIPIDEDGIIPEALDEACRRESPRLLYCAPTVHSPTTAIWPVERRRAIAEIADAHDVWIVEDEHPAFLLAEPPLPISAYAPERSFFIGDVWMALSHAVRTTYLLVPERWIPAMAKTIAATSGTTPALIAEVAARWIESDTSDRLIEQRRRDLTARNAILQEILGQRRLRSHPVSLHGWLELPVPWTSDRFARRLEQRGAAINPAEWFAVGHGQIPEAVRISTCNVQAYDDLRAALVEIDRLIDDTDEA